MRRPYHPLLNGTAIKKNCLLPIDDAKVSKEIFIGNKLRFKAVNEYGLVANNNEILRKYIILIAFNIVQIMRESFYGFANNEVFTFTGNTFCDL